MLVFGMIADGSSERRLSRPRRPSFVDRGNQTDGSDTSDSPWAIEDSRVKAHQSLFLQIPLDQSSGLGTVPASPPSGVSTSSSGLDQTNLPSVTIIRRREPEINGAGFRVAPKRRVQWLVATVSGGIFVGLFIGLIAGLLVFS